MAKKKTARKATKGSTPKAKRKARPSTGSTTADNLKEQVAEVRRQAEKLARQTVERANVLLDQAQKSMREQSDRATSTLRDDFDRTAKEMHTLEEVANEVGSAVVDAVTQAASTAVKATTESLQELMRKLEGEPRR